LRLSDLGFGQNIFFPGIGALIAEKFLTRIRGGKPSTLMATEIRENLKVGTKDVADGGWAGSTVRNRNRYPWVPCMHDWVIYLTQNAEGKKWNQKTVAFRK
jgi:hypothetical protein